jgi:hypothetical protein
MSYLWLLILSIFATFVQSVAAWDGGDTAALIIGLILGFLFTCALLGWYSRRTGSGYTETD